MSNLHLYIPRLITNSKSHPPQIDKHNGNNDNDSPRNTTSVTSSKLTPATSTGLILINLARRRPDGEIARRYSRENNWPIACYSGGSVERGLGAPYCSYLCHPRSTMQRRPRVIPVLSGRGKYPHFVQFNSGSGLGII